MEKIKPINAPFNSKQLARDLKAKVKTYGFSLRGAAIAAKVDPGTFINFINARSKKPIIDNLRNVCNWLNEPIQTYFK